jgi:glycerol-3-phosphate O-acyltransferase
MAPRELPKPYEPNPVLRALYERFFANIRVDEAWARGAQDLAREGTLVHVLGTLNIVDFLALDHLSKRFALPPIRFVNDLGLWVLNPAMGRGWWDLIFPRSPAAQLRYTIEREGSAVIFLRRPRGIVDLATGATSRRGMAEGEQLVKTLLEVQRQRDRPILLVPQVFVWTKRAESSDPHPLDLLEPSEWPNMANTVAQFLLNYRHAALTTGEPLNLKEFLANHPGLPEAEIQRRSTYVLLRRLDRARRSITGPAMKPPDRVRLEIVRSPRLRSAIEDLAGERDADRTVLTGQALAMLRELQARPDGTTRKLFEVIFRRIFARSYSGIEYEAPDIERLREASRKGTLILLPSHKSHFDYFFLSYVFNGENLPLPNIAAGDNLNFFPVGELLRRGGAFFIRRSFKGDRLYAAVVDAYIRRLMREGQSIEIFLEGARSRTGKLLPPKFGLLSMIVDAALSVADETETYFVPVSIGYERLAELRAYERELKGLEKKKESTAELLKTPEVLRNRYGSINLQVGQIVSMREVREELGVLEGALTPAKRRAIVTRIGNRVMDEINRVTAVTPGALTALGLMVGPPREAVSHRALYERCDRILDLLRFMGARVTPTTATAAGPFRPEALAEAVQMFLDAELLEFPNAPRPERSAWTRKHRLVASESATYVVPDGKRLALDVTKNMILHFFVERAIVATVLLRAASRPVALGVARDRVQKLSRLFKYEFRFRADAPLDDIFRRTLESMLERGEVSALGDLTSDRTELNVGPGSLGWSGNTWLELHASLLKNFLEGYRATARSLSGLIKGPIAEKEAVKRALGVGNRMLAQGELERREAITKPIAENALSAFVDEGYLRRRDGKLELAESFRTSRAASAIESRMASFLEEPA